MRGEIHLRDATRRQAATNAGFVVNVNAYILVGLHGFRYLVSKPNGTLSLKKPLFLRYQRVPDGLQLIKDGVLGFLTIGAVAHVT
jgi:hypothetical protein